MSEAGSDKAPIPKGVPINLLERATQLGKTRQAGLVRLIASVEQLTSLETIEKVPSPRQEHRGQQSYRYPPEVEPSPPPTCPIEPPTCDAFTVHLLKGKLVRDVWIDTHDLINEPGGYLLNWSRHGGTSAASPVKSLRLHLGIRRNRAFGRNGIQSPTFSGVASNHEGKDVILPGTITPTDDFAREIFAQMHSHPELQSLYVILEISKAEDSYQQKTYQDIGSTGFLPKFVPNIPISITKLQLEIPGISGAYLQDWKYLLDQQTSLQELICNFGVVMWNFYENCIRKNESTLQKIVLRRLQTFDVTKSSYVPMNWAIFSNCQNLAYLKVTCGYKTNSSNPPELSCPPTHVFLHENIESLPPTNLFVEFHLGKIWVEPCQLQQFCKLRSNLHVCLNCNDQEYCDEDFLSSTSPTEVKQHQQCYKLTKELRYFQLSGLELAAEIPQTGSLQKQQREDGSVPHNNTAFRSSQSRYGRIVLTLFIAILVALAMLFIVIFFKHLRSGRNRDSSFKGPATRNSRNLT